MITITSKKYDLKFPAFEDIKVSTKTLIVHTNVLLDLKKLFDHLKTTPYSFVAKKRGRKKKTDVEETATIVDDGSIITLKFEKEIKGTDLKIKKTQNKKKKGKWFRNSLTIVITINNKPTNVKVYKNGVFQITGCKFDSDAEKCIKFIWDYIKDTDIYEFLKYDKLQCFYIPAMRNMDFSVGFYIDREKFARYMSTQTEFHTLLETSFGYTGVSVKVKLENPIQNLVIKKSIYEPEEGWLDHLTTYQEYLDEIPAKDSEKKIKKPRYSSFLVFQSGRIIMSTINEETARKPYEYFLDIINTCYDQIEERLDL